MTHIYKYQDPDTGEHWEVQCGQSKWLSVGDIVTSPTSMEYKITYTHIAKRANIRSRAELSYTCDQCGHRQYDEAAEEAYDILHVVEVECLTTCEWDVL